MTQQIDKLTYLPGYRLLSSISNKQILFNRIKWTHCIIWENIEGQIQRMIEIIVLKIACHDCPSAMHNIGTSGHRCSRSPLGGRLATTLVATFFIIIFFCFFAFCYILVRFFVQNLFLARAVGVAVGRFKAVD